MGISKSVGYREGVAAQMPEAQGTEAFRVEADRDEFAVAMTETA